MAIEEDILASIENWLYKICSPDDLYNPNEVTSTLVNKEYKRSTKKPLATLNHNLWRRNDNHEY